MIGEGVLRDPGGWWDLLEAVETAGSLSLVNEGLDLLEHRIAELRIAIRGALSAGDREGVKAARRSLREAEAQWDQAVQGVVTAQPRAFISIREQVHQALRLLEVPAMSKLTVAVHEAFFAGQLASSQLTSLRRDEERSFRATGSGKPFYICAALNADLLSPARGMLALSVWPLAERIVGPLSPRVHFLRGAISVAEHMRQGEPSLQARRLLARMARNIPGAIVGFGEADPDRVIKAATAELDVHRQADAAEREAAAQRAARQLDETQQLFGIALRKL